MPNIRKQNSNGPMPGTPNEAPREADPVKAVQTAMDHAAREGRRRETEFVTRAPWRCED